MADRLRATRRSSPSSTPASSSSSMPAVGAGPTADYMGAGTPPGPRLYQQGPPPPMRAAGPMYGQPVLGMPPMHALPHPQAMWGQGRMVRPMAPVAAPAPGMPLAGMPMMNGGPGVAGWMNAPVPYAGAGGMMPFYPPYGPGPHYGPLPDPTGLFGALRQQIEYYFSVDNLVRDLYLRQQMDASGYVPLAFIASFNRVRMLSSDPMVIATALQGSSVVEVSNGHIRLRENWEKWILSPSPSRWSQSASPGSEPGSAPGALPGVQSPEQEQEMGGGDPARSMPLAAPLARALSSGSSAGCARRARAALARASGARARQRRAEPGRTRCPRQRALASVTRTGMQQTTHARMWRRAGRRGRPARPHAGQHCYGYAVTGGARGCAWRCAARGCVVS